MEATMRKDGPQLVPTPPSPEQSQPAVAQHEEEPKKRGPKRPLIILLLLAAVGGGGYAWHAVSTANEEETDDAQVEADVIPVSARIGGLVMHVRVQDNQQVHRGDVLVDLDRAEPEARAAQAEAELETARAQAAAADADVQIVQASASGGLHSARATVVSAVDSVRSAEAQIASARAGITRAQAQAQMTTLALQRARALRTEGAIAQAELDNAQAADDAAQAAVAQAQAQLATATAGRAAAASQIGQAQGRLEQSAPVDTQLSAARARADLAHARVRSAQAALDLARLNLSYTTITAASDGWIARLGVHDGQLLQAGQSIASLVPLASYVVANFKETQVGRMRAGQRVDLRIDAYPGRVFTGIVDSVSSGTGARFSLLPPDNASGNFVKVVQRVPVRVRWNNTSPDVSLRAGMSADVTVHFQ